MFNKMKSTKKAIVESYNNVVCVGYCDLQNLLHCQLPSFYTCGVYGWNADVYDFGSTAICTGYRPFGNASAPYGLIAYYEKLAEPIAHNYRSPWAERKQKLDELIRQFIDEVLDNDGNAHYLSAVKKIVKKHGGTRENDILNDKFILKSSDTWNDEHKVLNVLRIQPDNDGYRPGFSVDLVSGSICG